MKYAENIKEPDFWGKEFKFGNSSLTRGELENMPCPICGAIFNDDEMNDIVREIENYTEEDLGHSIDFDNDRDSEKWWENMEQVIMTEHDGIYYEDLSDEEKDEYDKMTA